MGSLKKAQETLRRATEESKTRQSMVGQAPASLKVMEEITRMGFPILQARQIPHGQDALQDLARQIKERTEPQLTTLATLLKSDNVNHARAVDYVENWIGRRKRDSRRKRMAEFFVDQVLEIKDE